MNLNKFFSVLHERYLLVISVLSFFVVLLYIAVITIHPLDLTAGSKDVTWINIIQGMENGGGSGHVKKVTFQIVPSQIRFPQCVSHYPSLFMPH